ncbi:hypothetical protein [Aminobacterium mobile]|uniref:hypothetical protein n=1 Tax=Aminobacterium mobile TaxID=81467 RepID=UPI00331616F5
MNTYEICNKNSNHSFGFFQADTEKEALEQLAKQAGYDSYREACAVVGSADELIVNLVETARNFVEKYFDGDLERGLFLLTCFTESQTDLLQFPDVILDDIDPAGFQEFCDAHNF